MRFISSTSTNQSSLLITKMDDKELIMTITFSYLFLSFLIHILFFLITIFNPQWQLRTTGIKHPLQRYFQTKRTFNQQSMKSSTLTMEPFCSNAVQIPLSESLTDEPVFSLSSSISSDLMLESETILNRTIRSYGLLLCSCLFLINEFRVGIYLFPKFAPNFIKTSTKICLVQSFLLHVLSLFHLNLTIGIRLFWYYCFIFSKYWQKLTYRRLLTYFLALFIGLCLFTWPSLSDEWGSIKFDSILKLCIVNYTFHWSYTFFLLCFTCLIPLILLIISHHRQMKSIDRRIEKYLSTLDTDLSRQNLHLIDHRNRFCYASLSIVIWTLINIILLIGLHIPDGRQSIKSFFYYSQLCALLVDPILYIFVFRSLPVITLLRPADEENFLY